jgi:hypothetical protein
MLIRKPKYPDVAPVVGQTDPQLSKTVFRDLYARGALSARMTFSSPLKKNKWDRPERLELRALHISNEPIDGIDGALSRYSGPEENPVHVALEDQDGAMHAVENLTQSERGSLSRGILTTDNSGNLWFCDATGKDQITGNETLRQMKNVTSPLMALCEGTEESPFSLTGRPMMGSLVRIRDEIICLLDDMVTPASMTAEQATVFEAALTRIDQRLDEITARREGISALVETYMTDEILSGLVEDMSSDLIDGLVPAYSDFDRAKAYNDKVSEISMNFMNALRDAGYCKPCPNNGSREVSSMTAWNVWMEGGFDKEDLPFETEILRHALREAPAFKVIDSVFLRASREIEKRIQKEESSHKPESGCIPASRIPEIFELSRTALLELFPREDDPMTLAWSENLRSSDDGTRYVLAGSFLTPELALLPDSSLDDPQPVPPLDVPAYLRHMEIPMPSGVLVMADWFRIEGFKEGLLALGCKDDYDINTAKGLDERARDYFEKAGICIVQVGNTSPSAILQEDGIWRMGYFDEDHERFWTEDGEPSDAVQPDIPWKTCTDLWANTFADRETVISVLMASDIYADRDEAAEVLDTYIEKSYGCSSVDLGVTGLHLYSPTGAGIHKGNFNTLFTADEIDKSEWIEDYYVLSAHDLSVDPALIDEENWISCSFDPEGESFSPT